MARRRERRQAGAQDARQQAPVRLHRRDFDTDDIVVFRIPNDAGSADDELAFSNDEDTFVPRPADCVLRPAPNPSNTIECPVAAVRHMTFDLGSLADQWRAVDGVNIDSTVDGGSGDDRLESRGSDDTAARR